MSAGRPALVLHDDTGTSVESLRAVNAKDADAYASFRTSTERLSSVIAATFDSPPPDIDSPSASDLWSLLKAGRRFRSLGKRDGYRLLRWLPMPISDLMEEWFEDERLQAMLAGPGVSGTMRRVRGPPGLPGAAFREASRRRRWRSNDSRRAADRGRLRRPWLPPHARPGPRSATSDGRAHRGER